jgi:hypothetical protein
MRRFVFDAHLSIRQDDFNISSVVSIIFLADLLHPPHAEIGLTMAKILINPLMHPEVVSLEVSEIPYDNHTAIRG